MEKSGKKLHDQEDLIQKAIKPNTKVSFLFSSIFCEIDQYITFNKQSNKNTKSFFQEALMEDPRTKIPKFQNYDSKPANFRLSEIFNKAYKKKKNDC